ncbi:rhomboid family intramembrane serine protease [Dactylosporangium sp. NPDC051485]|uniref:rhomboid family intramembrane serine protease n=1 Tax=Dactylosporangium sp. NPDC051485 TaxID=3154846 RepID=UPI003434111C
MDIVRSVLYIVLLVTAGVAGASLRGTWEPGAARRPPVATMATFAVVAVFSLLQLTVAPGLFEALRRDRAAIADGQVWRLVTSVVVQDGGWPGTISNLVALAVLGTLAERLWGTGRWLGIALAVQVLGGLWGLVAQPVGAGTSLVDFGLGASLAAAAVLLGTEPRSRGPAAVSLACAVALLVLGDIHGGAAVAGAAVAGAAAGAALAIRRRERA